MWLLNDVVRVVAVGSVVDKGEGGAAGGVVEDAAAVCCSVLFLS